MTKVRTPAPWPRRGLGSLYRRLQSLHFLMTRDRRAILGFLRARYSPPVPMPARLRLLRGFVGATNHLRSYHSQAQMLAVADAVLRRAGRPNLTLVECGCGKGSSTAKLSRIAEIAGARLYACDSFQGIPHNEEVHENIQGRRVVFRRGAFRGRLSEVQRNVQRFGAPARVEYRKGWFADTLPTLPHGIDVALLDVDLLASTRTCLIHIVPRMRPGGVIFTQDGHLLAIVDLLADATFWRDQIGIAPPQIARLGSEKFLAIPIGDGPPIGLMPAR